MEDNASQAVLLSKALESEEHNVTVTGDVAMAFQALRDAPYDLLITDLYVLVENQVAETGGISLITRARNYMKSPEASGRKPMPILAISGAVHYPGQERILEAARTVGADAYLKKPVSVKTLIEKVDDLLTYR